MRNLDMMWCVWYSCVAHANGFLCPPVLVRRVNVWKWRCRVYANKRSKKFCQKREETIFFIILRVPYLVFTAFFFFPLNLPYNHTRIMYVVLVKYFLLFFLPLPPSSKLCPYVSKHVPLHDQGFFLVSNMQASPALNESLWKLKPSRFLYRSKSH